MQFPEIPADFSALADSELAELLHELRGTFDEATSEGVELTDEVLGELTALTEGIETIRNEQGARAEAAAARQSQIAELAARVNPVAEDETEEETEEGAEETEEEAPAEVEDQPAEVEQPAPVEAPAQPVEAPQPEQAQALAASQKPKAVTAAASVAKLKRNAPARTRPRQENPDAGSFSIIASVDVPGMTPGQQVGGIGEVARLVSERFRTIGKGNGDAVPVVQFRNNVPDTRRLTRDMGPGEIAARLQSFDQTPQGITAAGGLCAPVNNYYEQMVVSGTARPVRDGLANFQADRGGIRYNPAPTLASVTGGIGTVTVAQDASGTTKTPFTVTCPAIQEVDVVAVYNSLLFGNIGARAFPEQVEAWTKLALSAQARKAETLLLDGIASASTSVTAAGLVGAGREVFARLGQVAAGLRSRHRTNANQPVHVMLPAWTLDLVQADFARTFTDETGLIQMDQGDINALFGTRNLNVSWYLDTKTGGGQIFGAADSGRSVSDGATNTNTTVTSATAAFTSADIGRPISGTGIPAGTTISAVTNATTVTISAAATATATGVTLRIGAHVLTQFPSTVYAYVFFEGSFLHLDAGTLDLGLVRDSTLNSTNQFQMFTESFENVALIGPESLEVVLSLQPDGSYGAARSVTVPIVS